MESHQEATHPLCPEHSSNKPTLKHLPVDFNHTVQPQVQPSLLPLQEKLKQTSSSPPSQSDPPLCNSSEERSSKREKRLKKQIQKLGSTQQHHKSGCQQIKFNFNQPLGESQIGLSPKKNIEFQFHQNNIENQTSPKKSSLKKRLSQKFIYNDQQSNSSIVESFKFPFVNHFIANYSVQYLETMEVMDKVKQTLKKTTNDTYINCDVKYFNWNLFIQEVGKFDVMIIDPPWRIKGAQQNDSQFMFSNCKFSLEYNTMANNQIARIPLHVISDEGFIFVWILNSQLDSSVEIMQTWGYEIVDELVWVKLKDEKINLTHGYYFMHSYQICLVGYKKKKNVAYPQEGNIKVRKNISWNTIFAEVRQKSQKPQDLYAIIDVMFKGRKKIEIFARNHNLRFGVFGMGNQLGESYDKWLLTLHCDICQTQLRCGIKRFKSKKHPNYDLCQKCISPEKTEEFFALKNNVDENIRHQYVSCDHCGCEPIWGIRFHCVTCLDFDLCENCYDKNLHEEHNFHPLNHEYMFIQVPVFGNGFHIHETKCTSCYQNPIIGIYFACSVCKNFNLCQKCYFQRPKGASLFNSKRHKPDHQLEAIFDSQITQGKKYQCFNCKTQILEHCWMCENCYNFFFCQKCFQNRQTFKSLYANTHKVFHVLTKIF